MENYNPKKCYNQFRQARRKKNKFAVSEINTDETSGRHYKLERFLRDCVIYLPKQEVEPEENEPANDDEPAVPGSKPKRPKHIKLPILNECKGIFENVIIGRSAKKAENFVGVGATPEDRARLEEDIHALAKVGPDSELSFEMIPPTQQQQENVSRPTEEQGNNQETAQITPPSLKESSRVEDVIPPVPDDEEMQVEYTNNQNRAFPEDENEPIHQNYIAEEEKTNNVDGIHPEEFYREEICNTNFEDSGFKGFPIASPRKEEEKSEKATSHHCDCCRKTAHGRSFFDTGTILKSNEAVWGKRIGANEIFGNRRDPVDEVLKGGWLFEAASGGPSNFLESTYPPPRPSEFHFKGIEIQSVGRQRQVLANYGLDRPRSHRPTESLKRRSRRMDLNNEAHSLGDDPLSSRNFSTEFAFHHLSPYNKYIYNRSLSPRKY